MSLYICAACDFPVLMSVTLTSHSGPVKKCPWALRLTILIFPAWCFQLLRAASHCGQDTRQWPDQKEAPVPSHISGPERPDNTERLGHSGEWSYYNEALLPSGKGRNRRRGGGGGLRVAGSENLAVEEVGAVGLEKRLGLPCNL